MIYDDAFEETADAINVIGDTGTDIPPGRAITYTGIPTSAVDAYSTVDFCAAGAWPWAVSWHSNTANLSPTFNGNAIPFSTPQIVVEVDAALAAGTLLKVTTDGKFGAANGAVACCKLMAATSAAGELQWVTTQIGRTRAAATTTVTTSGPTSTDAAFVEIAEMTATISITTGACFVMSSCDFDVRDGDAFDVAVYRDGVQIATSVRTLSATGADVKIPFMFSTLAVGLAAGSHTFALRWACASGTARATGVQRGLTLVELP